MIRRSHIMNLVITGLLVASAAPVGAQSAPDGSRGYVDAGFLADLDPYTYSDGTHGSPGGLFAAGVAFPSRWTMRFETALPAWHTEKVDTQYTSGGRTMTDSGVEK